MVFFDYLTENFEMIFELVGLLIMLGISVHIPDKLKTYTRITVALLFAESLAFHFEEWTQTFEKLSALRPILTAVVYSLYPLILIALMQVTTRGNQSKKKLLLYLIPELISVPLYFTSQWTRLICWFDGNNHYHGGVLNLLPYAVFVVYSIIFIIENVAYFKGISRISRLASVYIVAVPVIGMLYYRFFTEGKDYSALFSAAILLYFILIYISMAKTDPLTSLLNRWSYDLETEKNVTGVISVDMNGLKAVNDSGGHGAGDAALRKIADVLKSCVGAKASVYRIGGDEFAVLYKNASEEEVSAAVGKMRRQLAKTEYTCSFGYAMVKPEGTLKDAVRESDANMYAEKAAFYSEQENDRRGR